MTGEEFGQALLAAAKEKASENRRQDTVFMSLFESVVRRALGLPDPQDHPLPAPIPQLNVQPEFPQLRVKYDASGNEVAREVCHSLDDVGRLLKKNPGSWYVLPLDAPLPQRTMTEESV